MSAYELGRLVGVMVGFGVGLLLVAVAFKFIRRSNGKSTKAVYDERQEMVRGKGAKYTLYVVLAGGALLTLFGEYLANYISYPVMIFTLVCIGVVVNVLYCIKNEGYYALNDNRKRANFVFAFVGIINLIAGITGVCDEDFKLTDSLPSGMLNLICAATLLIIAIAIFIQDVTNKEEE